MHIGLSYPQQKLQSYWCQGAIAIAKLATSSSSQTPLGGAKRARGRLAHLCQSQISRIVPPQ